ncbi:MAG TPA: DUF1015 domain-containing protein [Candidatus Binataceae bacterium]|nr:DUF1015 domain-containing protein [Candidatus Binataceae bacterium]
MNATAPRRVEPLDALLFDPARTGSLDRVVAPPYDLIDQVQQEQLYARSPFNIVRLELSRESDPYASAAATLAQWRTEATLARASKPAFYYYTQRFNHAGRGMVRNGLIARVRLEEFASGRILPHERTFPKAKEDRLRLLTATRTNISSIFGLYPTATGDLRALLKRTAESAPLLSATDDHGIVNEVRALDSPGVIATVQESLEAARILIADGHHRYETALEYRRQRHAAAPGLSSPQGFDYVMMTLVAFDDPGLVILPTHRLVRRLPVDAIAHFRDRCREYFTVDEFAAPDQFLAALTARGRHALGVALGGQPGFLILALRDPASLATAMPDTPAAVRELEVSLLHTLVLDRIFGIKPDEVRQGGNIEYTIDGPAALTEVAAGRAAGAFLMNPPTVADIERVSSAGATMPEKSTYFFPKLLTGLVLNPLDD